MPRKRARSAASSSRKSATRASNARKRHTDRVAARQLRAEKTALTNQVRALRDAQKSLEQTRAHYSGLYDFAPVTYALIDRTGNVLSVNLAATRFLNVDRAHLIGFPLSGFVTPQDRGELLDHFRRSRFAQGIVESEVRFAVAGGSDVTCRLYTKRALHEGVDTFPTIIVDQTDRIALDDARLAAERRKEEAEQASELARAEIAAKDKFLATVSHELRTPLTPALFAASRLATWSGLPEPAQKLAATIRRNIEFEAHLIDDLLDIARINRDSLNLRLETVDVHDVLNEAVGICLQRTGRAEGHHDYDAPDRLRPPREGRSRASPPGVLELAEQRDQVHGERRQDHHPDGGCVERHAASQRPRHRNRDRVGGHRPPLCAIRSTTASEPEPSRPWTRTGDLQGDRRRTSWSALGRERRTGVGIDIRRRTDDGPGAPASKAAVPVGRAAKPAKPGTLELKRVLVVEDDADSRKMLTMFLNQHGYQVEVASLEAGVGRLAEGWDIVLSDIGLPDGSGLEIARQAREISPAPRRMIAFSGYGSTADRNASREAGFDAHIVKPIDFDRLLTALNGSTASRR